MAAAVLSGAAFGAALAASAMYRPGLIVAQLRLEDFTMLRIFLTATLSGGLAIAAGKTAGLFSAQPRSPSSKGWFSTYDGNIVGGLLQGVGMALTGACPGTVLVQAATGVKTGYITVAGGLLGGLLFNVLGPRIIRIPSGMQKASPTDTQGITKPAGPATLASLVHLGIPSTAAMALLAGAGLVAVLPQRAIVPPPLLQPVQAGVLIGMAQLLSILSRRKTMGVSTCYEDFWKLSSQGLSDSVLFAAGLGGGAFVLAQFADLCIDAASRNIPILGAFVGGIVSIFGARLAGGCTSGHGLSGTPNLGLASLITTACMFLGGIPVALALR